VENNGDRTVAFNTPLFVLPADAGKDDDPVVDLARTFGEGLLEIADESGRTVRIDYPTDSYCSDLENFIWSLHPYNIRKYAIDEADPQLLSLFRGHLQPEKQYFLRFARLKFPSLCEFEEYPWNDLEAPQVLQRVQIPCSTILLKFSTVAGTPTPRFTVSASISSSVCSLSGSPPFRLSLTVISLEKRSVTVCTGIDGKLDLWIKDSSFRWRKSGFKDLIRIANKHDIGVDMRRQEAQPDPIAGKQFPHRYAQSFIQFERGTRYTRHYEFNREDLSLLEHGQIYSLKLRPQGFNVWNYGIDSDLHDRARLAEWCLQDPIIFEPANAVALTLEAKFEAEQPMPFFRLPPELRVMVYEYLRYSETPYAVRFICDRYHEPQGDHGQAI
jgi:hypothetical protein